MGGWDARVRRSRLPNVIRRQRGRVLGSSWARPLGRRCRRLAGSRQPSWRGSGASITAFGGCSHLLKGSRCRTCPAQTALARRGRCLAGRRFVRSTLPGYSSERSRSVLRRHRSGPSGRPARAECTSLSFPAWMSRPPHHVRREQQLCTIPGRGKELIPGGRQKGLRVAVHEGRSVWEGSSGLSQDL